MEHNDNVKSKKKGLKKVICLFLLFILLFFGVGLTYLKIMSSKNYFEILVQNTFDYLEQNIDSMSSEQISGTFAIKMNANVKDTDTNEVLKILNKIDLAGEYGIDYEKKLLNLKFQSHYDNEDLVNLDVYTEEGNGYLYLENLYDKYIQFPIEEYNAIFERENHTEDYKVIFNSVEKALLNALKEEYFEKEKVTLRSVSVMKTTLNLTNENYQMIRKNIVDSLINDDDFLQSASRVLEKSISDIKNSFQENLEEDEGITDMNISIYTKGSQFYQLEVANNTDQFILYENENTYLYEYRSNNKKLCNGSVKKIDEKITIVFQLTSEEDFDLQVTLDASMDKNGKVDKQDITEYVSSEDISEEEMNSIYTKLLEREGFVELFQEISNISGMLNEDTVSGVVTS